jgi:hypothetical protein
MKKVVFLIIFLSGVVGLLANSKTVLKEYQSEIGSLLKWFGFDALENSAGSNSSKSNTAGNADTRRAITK